MYCIEMNSSLGVQPLFVH